MSSLGKKGRKLTQTQKKRHRLNVEKAVQQALLQHERISPALQHQPSLVVRSKPLTPEQTDVLKATIAREMHEGHILQPSFASSSLEIELQTSLLVKNWKQGWKWISNWSLAAIAYVTYYGVPPELINALPEATQVKVTLALAAIGFAGRFINQSRQASG